MVPTPERRTSKGKTPSRVSIYRMLLDFQAQKILTDFRFDEEFES